MTDFLLELGTEELPPKALKTLITALRETIEASLKAEELSFTAIKSFAAPRRLAVLVENLASETPSKELVVWGPPAAIAFDAEGKHPLGQPSPLLKKMAFLHLS